MNPGSITDFVKGNPAAAVGAVIGGLLVLYVLVKLFSGKKESEHTQTVVCDSCGWRGQVSRYAGRCPKCNDPLGDLKARR